MIVLQLVLRAALGAVLFRGRGGVFNYLACRMAGRDHRYTVLVSDNEARVLYALLMVTLQFDSMTLPELGVLAAALFLGAMPWPQRYETATAANRWGRFALLAIRGAWFTAPAGFALYVMGYDWWYGFVGLFAGVCFVAAEYIPSKVPQLRQGRELGEATYGGAQGLAFALI
jgi:hypothetical protein